MAEDQLSQFQAIISGLVARTRADKLEWTWVGGVGTTTLLHGRVIVFKDRDRDTVVKIQDTDSNELEEINTGYFEYQDLKAEANELYSLARRSGLQIDSKLASILSEISP